MLFLNQEILIDGPRRKWSPQLAPYKCPLFWESSDAKHHAALFVSVFWPSTFVFKTSFRFSLPWKAACVKKKVFNICMRVRLCLDCMCLFWSAEAFSKTHNVSLKRVERMMTNHRSSPKIVKNMRSLAFKMYVHPSFTHPSFTVLSNLYNFFFLAEHSVFFVFFVSTSVVLNTLTSQKKVTQKNMKILSFCSFLCEPSLLST